MSWIVGRIDEIAFSTFIGDYIISSARASKPQVMRTKNRFLAIISCRACSKLSEKLPNSSCV